MPVFSYIATNKQNKSVTGTMEVADRTAVLSSLTKEGLRPVSIRENRKPGGFSFSFGDFLGQNKVMIL
jgi:type II secretory pathway component PulF